jgi:hypothetical protein
MKNNETGPQRLDVWGDSMMGKPHAITRKRRKRSASKKRRQILRKRDKID